MLPEYFYRPLEKKLTAFRKTSLLHRFQQDIAPRGFFETYQIFFYLAIGLAFLAQLASALSSYQFIADLVAYKIPQGIALITTTILLLGLIEILKYFIFRLSFQKLFAQQPEITWPLWVLALIISAFSAYASIMGGGQLALNPQAEAQKRLNFGEARAKIQAQIHAIQNSDAHKQIIWLGNGQTSKVLSQQGQALIQKREAELDTLRQEETRWQAQQSQTNQAKSQRYQLIFGIFEVLFLLASGFVWYFKRRVVLDEVLRQANFNSADNQPHLDFFVQRFAEALQSKFKGNENKVEGNSRANEAEGKVKIRPVGFEIRRVQTNPAKPSKPQSIFKVENPTLQNKLEGSVIPEENPEVETTSTAKPQILGGYHLPTLASSLASQNQGEKTAKLTIAVSSQSKAKFENFVQKMDLRNAKYLQKYREVVELIFEMQSLHFLDNEIRDQVTQHFAVGETTYYNIKRILNNPTA
jgi:hypothetical protein